MKLKSKEKFSGWNNWKLGNVGWTALLYGMRKIEARGRQPSITCGTGEALPGTYLH